MNAGDAYEDMGAIRALSERDLNGLLAGRTPSDAAAGLDAVAEFVRALGAGVPQPAENPDPALITRLADAAAAGARKPAAPAQRPMRSRRRLIARIGIAVAAVPLLFAGLAVAGVKLPGPADDAFESVGVELPNQATDDTTGDDVRSDEADGKGSSGKGEATRRSKRQAHGPSRAARKNPPGKAVRRGPNETPGTPRGKPDSTPSKGGGGGNAGGNSGGSNAGGNAGGNSAFGHAQGKSG